MHLKKGLFVILILLLLMMVPQTYVDAATKIPSGSSIGNVDLAELTLDEAREKLQTEVERWHTGAPLVIQSEYEKIFIPRSSVQFHIDESLANLKKQMRRDWSRFFSRKENIHLPLNVTIQEKKIKEQTWPKRVSQEKAVQYVVKMAENLDNQQGNIVYQSNPETDLQPVAEVSLPIKNLSSTDIKYMADSITDESIGIEESFSFLDTVRLPEQLTESNPEIDFFATAFYRLFLHTNVRILEKHSHDSIPSYGEVGIEARVNPKKSEDLLIYNPNSFAYFIDAGLHENNLLLSLKAVEAKHTYNYHVKEIKKLKPKKVYRYSRDLAANEEIVIASGEEGYKGDLYRARYSKGKGNALEKEELLSRAYYPPSPQIILTSNKNDVDNLTGDEEGKEEKSDKEQLEHTTNDSSSKADGKKDDVDDANVRELKKQVQNMVLTAFQKEYCEKAKNKTEEKEGTEETAETAETEEGEGTAETKEGKETANQKTSEMGAWFEKNCNQEIESFYQGLFPLLLFGLERDAISHSETDLEKES